MREQKHLLFDKILFPAIVYLDEIILDKKQLLIVENIIRLYRKSVFREIHKLYIYGSAGCGKTLIAKAIATHLSCPLFSITSLSDEKKISHIFDFLRNNYSIVLIEHIEEKVLNCLVDNMIKYKGLGLFIVESIHFFFRNWRKMLMKL